MNDLSIPLPALFLDQEAFKKNIINLIKVANPLPLRLATKSIRSVDLIKEILLFPGIKGLLCYSLEEANFLCAHGLDDILVAYPSLQISSIKKCADWIKKGKSIVLIADLPEHLQVIEKVGREYQIPIPICLDIDLSWRLPFLHFGVHRSSLHHQNKDALEKILALIKNSPFLKLEGVMGYEAQIAGVQDRIPIFKFHQWIINLLVRVLKKMAKPRILKQRKELVAYIKNAGHPLKFVNGGGTGSLVFTKTDEVVTELAAGSGVFAPTLFDYYDDFKLSSALFYALEITRHPQKNIYTANGGGYVASGAIGLEKLPCSYYQGEFVLTAHEGVGEVQTPMIFQKPQQVGNPVYFRHAKSGEICERFNQIHVLDKGKLLKTVNTYRGDGQCFF